MIKYIGMLLLCMAITGANAQDKVIDQIVAVVGGNIIMKSDVENMAINQQAQGISSDGDMKCEILEQFLINKLLVAEAELDTLIIVTPSEVNQQMDAQMQSYLQYFGTEKAVETYFNKPIATIKSDMESAIREQLLSQKMRNKIVGDITVTPSEVRLNYRNLKPDEIPNIPTQYEYAQITLEPKVGIEEGNRVKSKLREIKKKIENGSSFSAMAILYSEGPSAKEGGVIGYSGRAQLDPAYAAAAFNLKGDKISDVVKSDFGYHIIQLVDKKGEKVNTRHILMRPKISVEAKEDAYSHLDSLANLIRKDEIPFEKAAGIFSYDKNSRNNGGIVINPNSMSSKFAIEDIAPDVSKVITGMNINEVSKPFESINTQNQRTLYKIIKLTDKVESHKADLQHDYQKLAAMYLAKKKEDVLEEWISKRQSQTYIRIDDTYANCNFKFKEWIK